MGIEVRITILEQLPKAKREALKRYLDEAINKFADLEKFPVQAAITLHKEVE